MRPERRNLLDPADPIHGELHYRDLRMLERLAGCLHNQPSARHGWVRAEARILPSLDGCHAIAVTLETAHPFGLARHWFVKGTGPFRMQALRVSDWPDATPQMRVAPALPAAIEERAP